MSIRWITIIVMALQRSIWLLPQSNLKARSMTVGELVQKMDPGSLKYFTKRQQQTAITDIVIKRNFIQYTLSGQKMTSKKLSSQRVGLAIDNRWMTIDKKEIQNVAALKKRMITFLQEISKFKKTNRRSANLLSWIVPSAQAADVSDEGDDYVHSDDWGDQDQSATSSARQTRPNQTRANQNRGQSKNQVVCCKSTQLVHFIIPQ